MLHSHKNKQKRTTKEQNGDTEVRSDYGWTGLLEVAELFLQMPENHGSVDENQPWTCGANQNYSIAFLCLWCLRDGKERHP